MTLPGDSNAARFRLRIDLDAPRTVRVRSVVSPTPDTLVAALDLDVGGHGGVPRVSLDVKAPRVCPAFPNREPVTILVTYELEEDDELHSERLDVDHRCLLGDVAPSVHAGSYARLASRYAFDPIIDELVSKASALPRDSVEKEVERVLRWLHFDAESVQQDPLDAASGWSIGTAYALSPSETARLGGDCEDWAILLGAYLARRGWTTSLVHTFGHVWARVADPARPGQSIDVDPLGVLSGAVPSSEELVHLLEPDVGGRPPAPLTAVFRARVARSSGSTLTEERQ